MVQGLAPTHFRPLRSSLRLQGRLRIAVVSLVINEGAATSRPLLATTPAPPVSLPGQDQESDQESHDTEDLSETFAWSEAMTDRRSVPHTAAAALHGTIAKP